MTTGDHLNDKELMEQFRKWRGYTSQDTTPLTQVELIAFAAFCVGLCIAKIDKEEGEEKEAR